MLTQILVALMAFAWSVPAWAKDGPAVPEGSHATLFALGVLGVIVGRRASIAAQRRAREREGRSD